jgi:hypothetical protein
MLDEIIHLDDDRFFHLIADHNPNPSFPVPSCFFHKLPQLPLKAT